MKRLAAARAAAMAIPASPFLEYEPAGILISAAGGMAVGVWLDYLRPTDVFQWIALVLGVSGVGLAVIAKNRRRRAEAEARERWQNAPEREAYERMARDLAAGWFRFVYKLKERGFHTEIRVAEGSSDPLRLASLDPRPFQGAQGFDPEDWMPTEADASGNAAVRYETIHADGGIATRLLPGTQDYPAPKLTRERSEPARDVGREAADDGAGATDGTPSDAGKPKADASDVGRGTSSSREAEAAQSSPSPIPEPSPERSGQTEAGSIQAAATEPRAEGTTEQAATRGEATGSLGERESGSASDEAMDTNREINVEACVNAVVPARAATNAENGPAVPAGPAEKPAN
jgi:hypothetical protein